MLFYEPKHLQMHLLGVHMQGSNSVIREHDMLPGGWEMGVSLLNF